MSLQLAAQHLAAHGRHGDTTLVHMSTKELRSLNDVAKAHGTNITTNPHTGLPEAFSLRSLLPAVLGAGLTVASGGALTPLMAAGIVGGGYAVASGDLKKGLMAGLGAYGGAGLGAGVGAAGAETSITSSAPVETLTPTPVSPDIVRVPDISTGTGGFQTTPGVGVNAPPPASDVLSTADANNPMNSDYGGTVDRTSYTTKTTPNYSAGMDKTWEAIQDDPMKWAGENKYYIGAAAAPAIVERMTPKPLPVAPVDRDMGQRYDYNPNYTNDWSTDPSGMGKSRMNPTFTKISADEAKARYGYASGGIADLGGYSDGGRLLRGPGDGVSDSIPATIGGKQPAKLADGEFVVPARIVSELGNGSSEAGARKLYAMLDRVQKARSKTVGKGKVAKNSRSEKYLPA